MKKFDATHRSGCPINLAVEVFGDKWSLVILRDMIFGGRRHFRELLLRSEEGIASNMLADRLKTLVEEGVLRKDAYQDRPLRHEYRLTEKGLALHPVIMAIVHWGDEFYAGEAGPPLLHRHRACGCDFTPVTTCSECGGAVSARDVEVRPGSGL